MKMRTGFTMRGIPLMAVVLIPIFLSMPGGMAVPTSVVATVSATGTGYRIGQEDVLHVSVWENEELTLDVVVRPDGKISMPLIQDIQAEGKTSEELADLIHQKLLPFVKNPAVTVIVKEVNAPKIFVTGYVTKPGTYPLRGDLSVLQALSLAGGFTEFASPRKIRLIRNNGGKQEIRLINYHNLLDSGEGNLMMKSGDTLVVP